jgi:dihydrofolate reductase
MSEASGLDEPKEDAMTTNPASTEEAFRRVVAEIVLSLDGRVNRAGGEYDMSWIVPHAISDTSRDRTAGFTQSSTTALVGRKNYEGFAGYWPSVADDEAADLRDRTFSRWFTSVQKVVFSTSITERSLPNTTVTSDPPGGDIIVLASSSVIRQLLEADAVDRLSIMLCPETSGAGSGCSTTASSGAGIGPWRRTRSPRRRAGA